MKTILNQLSYHKTHVLRPIFEQGHWRLALWEMITALLEAFDIFLVYSSCRDIKVILS